MSTSTSIADVLKQAREARGWTQEELARRAAVRVESISRTETRKRGLGDRLRLCLGRAFLAAPREGDPVNLEGWISRLSASV